METKGKKKKAWNYSPLTEMEIKGKKKEMKQLSIFQTNALHASSLIISQHSSLVRKKYWHL